MFVLFSLSPSASGIKVRLTDDFSATAYIILSFIGGTDITVGFCILRDLLTDALVLLVAVAVSAITITLSGIMLRSSPRWENSLRRLSPLQRWKSYVTVLYTICWLSAIYQPIFLDFQWLSYSPFFDTMCLVNNKRHQVGSIDIVTKHLSPLQVCKQGFRAYEYQLKIPPLYAASG